MELAFIQETRAERARARWMHGNRRPVRAVA
jgi:hypothetical protein